jgi:nicotinate-nucleotide pyrophosphorylase (carboxylating)
MIMLKDNHIWSAGNITEAVKRAKSVGGFALKVEVECQSESEAEEAIKAGADIVMLDNFEPKNLHVAAANLKAKYQHVIIEGSGGINLDTLASYLSPHVDVLSMGGLTQGVQHIDFSLKIKPAK